MQSSLHAPQTPSVSDKTRHDAHNGHCGRHLQSMSKHSPLVTVPHGPHGRPSRRLAVSPATQSPKRMPSPRRGRWRAHAAYHSRSSPSHLSAGTLARSRCRICHLASIPPEAIRRTSEGVAMNETDDTSLDEDQQVAYDRNTPSTTRRAPKRAAACPNRVYCY